MQITILIFFNLFHLTNYLIWVYNATHILLLWFFPLVTLYFSHHFLTLLWLFTFTILHLVEYLLAQLPLPLIILILLHLILLLTILWFNLIFSRLCYELVLKKLEIIFIDFMPVFFQVKKIRRGLIIEVHPHNAFFSYNVKAFPLTNQVLI